MKYSQDGSRRNWLSWLVSAVCFSIAIPSFGAVSDVFPDDYVALPEGVSSASLYYYDSTQTGPYSNGKNTQNWQIHASIAALLLTHSTKIAGMTVSPFLALPYAEGEISGVGSTAIAQHPISGMADSRIGVTLWFYNDAALRQHLAVSATLLMPTGSYDANAMLNIGENRYTRALSMGWIHGFGDNITLDVTPEIAWYSDNTSYQGSNCLEQAPTYALTSYLRYKLNPDWQAFVGYQSNRGGDTRVNAIDNNNAINIDRLYLGGTYRFAPSIFVDFRYNQGQNFVNGFVLKNELALRISKLF